jgi:hypothetical protein
MTAISTVGFITVVTRYKMVCNTLRLYFLQDAFHNVYLSDNGS